MRFMQPDNQSPLVATIGRRHRFFATREQLSKWSNRKFRIPQNSGVHGMKQEFVMLWGVQHEHRSDVSQTVIEQEMSGFALNHYLQT